MRKFLNSFPLHTFLFIFFISLFLFAQNPEHVTLAMMPRTFFLGSVLSALIFLLFYAFLKNKIKAGIISTLLLLILFNYGVMYDIIEYFYYLDLWPFKNIHRYLSAFTFLLCVLVIYIVVKKVHVGSRINYFLNVLFILLILFNSTKLFYLHYATKTSAPENESTNSLKTKESNLPNLYYIVLDGYANQHILKQHYNFDNSDFIGFLEQKGFFIADSSIANYYSTVPSLSSTFNLDYHKNIANDNLKNLRNNSFFKILKSNGYSLYKLQSGYSVTSGFADMDSTITINTPNEFERSILKFTVFRLDDLFGIIQYRRLKSQFDKLPETATLKKNRRFVFVHIVAPHPPFVFNENGEQIFNNKNNDNYWEPKESYVKQLMFVNKQIKNYISLILKEDQNAAIIIQSDHGPWIQSQDGKAVFDSRAMILNGMRLAGEQKFDISRSVSSVNTFRIFIKKYFDPSYPLLLDKPAGKDEMMNSILYKERKIN